MTEASIVERVFRLRLAAMDWLGAFGDDHKFAYRELADFRFEGRHVPLIDYTRGIRKPRMRGALSMRTVPRPSSMPPGGRLAGRTAACLSSGSGRSGRCYIDVHGVGRSA